MSSSNSVRKWFFWTVICLGIVVLAFFFGKSQRKIDTSLGIRTTDTVSKEVLNLQDAFANVADEIKPTVVSIYTEQVIRQSLPFNFFYSDPFEDFFDQFFGRPSQPERNQPQQRYSQKRVEGAGSGVIIDKDGYILTNYHVVRNAEKITVKLANNKEYIGKVIGKDAKTDLAVVKIKPYGELIIAKLGDSDKIRVGQWVIAIGSPFGLEQTVTVGIISAKRQNISVEGNVYRDFIQTDASINRGNSGGPLLNIFGEVVGINTAIFSQSGGSVGVGFAIPINRAKNILDSLITKGKVERGFLGVKIENVDEVFAKQSGLKEISGVVLTDVIDGLSADKAGLKRGDIILEFNGKKIDSVEKLQDIVSATEPNKKINVIIWRDRTRKNVSVILGEWTEEVSVSSPEQKNIKEQTASWNGMSVKEFKSDMARELNVSPDEKGVVIIDIKAGSKADEMGLYIGDIIRAINNQRTITILEFESVIKKVSLTEGVLFDINRGGNLIYKTFVQN
ncbi:MAG: hypothetical protein A2474_07880 [Elusimicrobia bacterium RIFOXYC2_FULL_34_12]|nr:MAG: hypothetical protein A2474_07880 [Elusimicrobia bacterium RIFOXYC2_FULL_34_12]OGS37952.1 MAG: hypothetical protein A2551_04385 [Elusimicrobia bacterium RIFOXYD2_FULL_34_30]HAM39585.1 hypothetical protein [Elusimicrobiota bacterium]